MRCYVLCLLSVLLLSFAVTPKKVSFSDLGIKKFKDVWLEEYKAYFSAPKFSKSQKDLDGVLIEIEGVLSPIEYNDTIVSHMVLSGKNIDWHSNSPRQDELVDLPDFSLTIGEYKELAGQRVKFIGVLKLNFENDVFTQSYRLDNSNIQSQKP